MMYCTKIKNVYFFNRRAFKRQHVLFRNGMARFEKVAAKVPYFAKISVFSFNNNNDIWPVLVADERGPSFTSFLR